MPKQWHKKKRPSEFARVHTRMSPSIAFQKMDEIRAQYKEMASALLFAGSEVAIATHDDELIEWAKKFAEDKKISKDQFEFQMLYGLRRKKSKELVSEGYRVRSYVPYGTHWFSVFLPKTSRTKRECVFCAQELDFRLVGNNFCTG